MATRIDIELTSSRPDEGTFTWRAAGAKQPRGVAEARLFPENAGVGDVFKVDADVDVDGITVTFVHPPKGARKEPPRLELLRREEGPAVTTQLAEKGRGRGDRRDRGERGERRPGDRDRGPRPQGDRPQGDRPQGDRPRRDGESGRARDQRPTRPPPKPKLAPKPKPPRLRAGRAHRNALLEGLKDEERAIAEQVLKGGLQGVRAALAKQNEENKAQGRPEVSGEQILALAERLLGPVRQADWRDRAEAALESADTVDLRDLRTVVTAAEGVARDEETRALAEQLRSALNRRLEAEQHAWVAEIVEMLDDDRVVRALHLSSRPPKAGAPLPVDVARRLVDASSAAMNSEVTAERWIHVLEALAHSPVRSQVVPASLPANVTPELKATIARLGTRLEDLAKVFGVEPNPKAERAAARRPRRPDAPRRAEGARRPIPAPPATGTAPADAAVEAGAGETAEAAAAREVSEAAEVELAAEAALEAGAGETAAADAAADVVAEAEAPAPTDEVLVEDGGEEITTADDAPEGDAVEGDES